VKTAGDFVVLVRKSSLLAGVVAVLSGCNRRNIRAQAAFVPEAGDLLFQDLDSGPLCDAIEKVTTGYEGASFSHVGIAAADDNGGIVVIEAVSSGVEVTPLPTFLGRSLDAKGRPKVVVGRLKKAHRHLIAPAIEEAFVLKGKPYDKVFAVDNDAYYCSELVYEIFRRANNDTAVFELQPMTFREPDSGQTQRVWQEYFSALGVPVPEGRPGINPGGISRSTALVIIYKYGSLSRSLRGKKPEPFSI
jgi:hypothetical protein